MYRQISRRQMLGFVGVAALTPSLLLEEPVHAKKRGTPSSKERGAPVESISQPQFMETGRVISTEPGTGKLLHLELVICATLPDGRTIKKQIDFLNLSTDIISQTKKYFDVRMIGNGIVLTMDEREVRVFSLGIEDEDIKPQMIQRYDHTSHASENFIGKKEIIQVAIDSAKYENWQDAVLATITRDGFFHVWNAGTGNGTYIDLDLMLKKRKWPTLSIATASIYLHGADWFILPIGLPGANVNFGYSVINRNGGIVSPETDVTFVSTNFADYGLRNFFRLVDDFTAAGSEGSPESVKATVDCEKEGGMLKFGFTLILEPIR
ncbi:TPA: hypothetical protein HA238_05255 [Candidatus Micrarchaeota archaeon]|nr:hypothetical protein [Candidatus Micrarchaeota archaeon]